MIVCRRIVSLLVLGVLLAVPAAWAQPDGPAWRPLPEALEAAARDGRPVLVYVSAVWCGPCRAMERDVFPEAAPLMVRFSLARLDFGDHDTRLEIGGEVLSPFGWARRLGVDVTPGFVLLQPDGTPITRVASYLDAPTFGRLLGWAATGAYRHASFPDYLARTRPGG